MEITLRPLMEVYRIARDKYAKSLNASGKAARWNKEGQFVLYASEHRSLAALEMVVHRAAIQSALSYQTMVITLSDNDHLYTTLQLKDLPPNWRETAAPSLLQKIGSKWYEANQSLVLKVPSVIVPQEFNFLINAKHPYFTKKMVALTKTENFFWDDRLGQ